MREARSAATNATLRSYWKDLPFSALKLQLWKKGAGFQRVCALAYLLGGLRRRAVSEAHALELEFKEIAIDSKSKTDCGPLGGLGQRPVSKAHAVERELELELELESKVFDPKESLPLDFQI